MLVLEKATLICRVSASNFGLLEQPFYFEFWLWPFTFLERQLDLGLGLGLLFLSSVPTTCTNTLPLELLVCHPPYVHTNKTNKTNRQPLLNQLQEERDYCVSGW